MPLERLPPFAREHILEFLDLGTLLRGRGNGNRFWKQEFDRELQRHARSIMGNPPRPFTFDDWRGPGPGFTVEFHEEELPRHHLNRHTLIDKAIEVVSSQGNFIHHMDDWLTQDLHRLSQDLWDHGSGDHGWYAAEIIRHRSNLEEVRLEVRGFWERWVYKWIRPSEQKKDIEDFHRVRDIIACVVLFAAKKFFLTGYKVKIYGGRFEETVIVIHDEERSSFVITLKARTDFVI